MTAIDVVADPAPILRFELRSALPTDMDFILDSWRKSWRKRARRFDHAFALHVRQGLLTQPDTQIVVAAAEYNTHRIWGWVCFTPGLVPTIHYVLVRPVDFWAEGDVAVRSLRGNGLFWTLLAAAGVTREFSYTFRPRSEEGLEQVLLTAADKRGVIATYRDIERDFLRLRMGRR